MPTVPRCYAAHHDAESGDFVILLQDLAGYAGGDQLQGQRLTQESDGNDRAKTWRRREIGCGARGTEVAQGPDEKR